MQEIKKYKCKCKYNDKYKYPTPMCNIEQMQIEYKYKYKYSPTDPTKNNVQYTTEKIQNISKDERKTDWVQQTYDASGMYRVWEGSTEDTMERA